MSELNNLVYKILGAHLDGEYAPNSTVSGSTYNWIESPLPHSIMLEYGDNAPVISLLDALNRINELVQEDKAMSSATVQAIYELNKLLPSNSLDYNKINNRELKVRLMAQDPKSRIDSDIVYNVLFYLVTGKTLYVRTFREFRRVNLGADGNVGDVKMIEAFISSHVVVLAQYYRRNRSLLLYIKNQLGVSKETRSMINRISKASRMVNKPTSNKTFKDIPLTKKPTLELTKMLTASDTITIRNGRKFTVATRSKEPYDRKAIISELKTRNDLFTPEQIQLSKRGWHLSVPHGDKNGLGNIPNGSWIDIHKGDKIGVRWYRTDDTVRPGAHIDLDLSVIVRNSKRMRGDRVKYGWDADVDGDVTFSGDMTHLVNGEASEDFVINYDNLEAVIDLSSFSYGDNVMVELYVGDEVVPIEKPASSTVLGLLSDNKFYINYQEYGSHDVAVSDTDIYRGLM